MATQNLGRSLRDARLLGNFGSIEVFCKLVGVNKNTLGAYERGERLPDVDFLSVFAEKTGKDFFYILKLRLNESKNTDAHLMAQRLNDLMALASKKREQQVIPESTQNQPPEGPGYKTDKNMMLILDTRLIDLGRSINKSIGIINSKFSHFTPDLTTELNKQTDNLQRDIKRAEMTLEELMDLHDVEIRLQRDKPIKPWKQENKPENK
ncbi:MAG: helix-turn-helix transcriptional regulator [Pseudomonadota bacterium]